MKLYMSKFWYTIETKLELEEQKEENKHNVTVSFYKTFTLD